MLVMVKRNPYSSQQWRKLREQVLAERPLCEMCMKVGVITAANTVDHIEPHKGKAELFWARENLQSLCPSHHSGLKQSVEKGGPGHDTACGVDGNPIDPDHPWNQGR